MSITPGETSAQHVNNGATAGPREKTWGIPSGSDSNTANPAGSAASQVLYMSPALPALGAELRNSGCSRRKPQNTNCTQSYIINRCV